MIGEEKILPKDWKLTKMEEVCDIISGKNQSKVINPNGKYPIYGSSGIFGYADEYLCNEGTTVVGRKGTINSPLFVKTKFWNVDTAFGLSPKENYENKLLYYFCMGFNFHKLDKSTTIPSLAKRDLLAIDIPLPPKPTQQAIVSKIEELFSELDKGIEQLKTAQQQLKTYRQSVLKWAFEGKLTNANVKDVELPEGWEWMTLKDITSILGDGLHGTPKYSENGDYYFINGNNLSNGKIIYKGSTKRIDFEEYQKHRKELNETTILVSINGTLGNTAFYSGEKVILGKSACYFNLKPTVNKFYIRYIITSQRFSNYAEETATGSTIPNVSLKAMREFKVPIAPIEEQNKIVQEIESRLSVADKMEESITQSLQQAEALRQSILKKAFEGKLIVETTPTVYKPKNDYFFECQILAYILRTSKKRNVRHGEMTLAKYAYLAVKIFGIPLTYVFQQWHLGPYPPEIKKAVNNKQFFLHTKAGLELTEGSKLFNYNNPYQQNTEEAVNELISIFEKYNDKLRSHKTELLATVCKAIEDTKSTDFIIIRKAMKNWKIDLKNSAYKNKAEKFGEEETQQCVAFIVGKGWDKKLINTL